METIVNQKDPMAKAIAFDAIAALTSCRVDDITQVLVDNIFRKFPITDKYDAPCWQEGARDLICGLCVSFVNDVITGKWSVEEVQFPKLYQNLIKFCSDEALLEQYFESRKEEYGMAYEFARKVLMTTGLTRASYIAKAMNWLNLYKY